MLFSGQGPHRHRARRAATPSTLHTRARPRSSQDAASHVGMTQPTHQHHYFQRIRTKLTVTITVEKLAAPLYVWAAAYFSRHRERISIWALRLGWQTAANLHDALRLGWQTAANLQVRHRARIYLGTAAGVAKSSQPPRRDECRN